MSVFGPTALLVGASLAGAGLGFGLSRWRARRRRTADDGLVEQLLANLAHELRTPLTALLGFAEIAQEPAVEDDRRSECIDRVRDGGQQLLRVVNDLLDHTRLLQGRLAIHPVDCAPRESVARIEQRVTGSTAAAEREMQFDVHLDASVPARIRIDPDRVEQIACSLLDNAARFTRRGQVTLHVSANVAQQHLHLEVRDTGDGLSNAMRDALARLDLASADTVREQNGSPSRRQSGVGLGLALSRDLARALGGRLQVETAGNGVTRVRVELPYAAAAPSDQAITQTPEARPKAKRSPDSRPALQGKVLIVEDGRDNQLLIRTVLTRLGLQVTIAENGLLALRAIEQEHFDAVLMDMQMPVMDGYEATRKLREQQCELPIIALTAHALSGDREKCLEAGCDEFLTKPLDRPALTATLQHYLHGEDGDSDGDSDGAPEGAPAGAAAPVATPVA